MLTDDEIKRLKNGDKLLAEVKFSGLDDNGEVRVFTDDTAPNGEPMESYYWFEQFELSIPPDKPKYDPCRRFRKGDLVTPKKVNGRSSRGVNGEIYRVYQDELESGCEIKLVMDGCIGYVPVDAAYLELVTPVEKMWPYKVEKKLGRYIVYYQDPDEDGMTGRVYEKAAFYFGHPKQYTEDEALAAAETELERLNDEWRKEHESDHKNS